MKEVPSHYALLGIKAPGIITISAEVIISRICAAYNTSLEELRHETRKREIVFVRQLLMYVLKRRTHLTNQQIGTILNQDKTQVTRSEKSISNYIATDSFNKRNEIIAHLQNT